MIKKLTLALFMLVTMLPLASCGNDDEPTQVDTISTAEISYTYTVNEEMLEYFNITANYYNSKGEKVGKQMNSPMITITTTADKFPAQRPLSFTVTRTDHADPETTPTWICNLSVIINRTYQPSGSTVAATKSTSRTYSPRPDKFGVWAESYIKEMATPYDVTISSDGEVNF